MGHLSGQLDRAQKGMSVKFTATFEPSKDDPAFGFFSRPCKAEVTGDAPIAVSTPAVTSAVATSTPMSPDEIHA